MECTCKECIYNDDLLCDFYGTLIEDEDPACPKYTDKQKEE